MTVSSLLILMIVLFLALAVFLGTPIAVALGLAAVAELILQGEVPLMIAAQRVFNGVNSVTLMGIPFFMLVGSIMERSGITQKLIDFANSLVGWLCGGLCYVGVLTGILMGGISGYFGGWIDNIIMRIVDVFYCIPSMPVIIIIGAAMDAMRVDSWKRMMYLMLILGFLGWPSIARLVRGQILSLREQEFMLATEACGIKVWHRIFRHLIPNVIPQLIVTCTMGLGSTILTEATLSFLGLGVKYPFASWGNIINDVNNAYRGPHAELPVHLDPCRCLPAAHRSGLQLCGRRSARCV